MGLFDDLATGVSDPSHVSPGPGYTWVSQGTNGGGYWQPPGPFGAGSPLDPNRTAPGVGLPGSGGTGLTSATPPSVDANGNIVTSTGAMPPGDHTLSFLGNLARLPKESTFGLWPTDGNQILQKVVNTQPIYQTGEFTGQVPTPFGGYGVNVPPAQSVPIGNQLVDAVKGLIPSSGGGAPPPPPGAPLNPGAFGWGNFSPGAQQQSGFFNDLAAYHANQAAPTLQRTGVDWSGMGGGGMGQPAPPMPQQSAYPSMGQQYQTGATPPPAATNINQAPGGQLDPMAAAQRALYAPPGTSGAAPTSPTGTAQGMSGSVFNPSGGQVTSTYSGGAPASASNQRVTPGAAQPAIAEQPVVGGPRPQPTQGYQPSPAPPPPQQNAPSSSQFANPLFQQSQQSRGVTQGVMGQLENPNMYATPQQGVEASGRSAEMTALNRAADPNLTRTAEGAQQQQSRGIQGATMAATTAPGMYNTPGAAQQDQARQQQQSFLQRLSGDMNGGQPSLAETQLRRGSDAVVANANALAASAGPGGAAMARRQAMQTAAGQGGKLAADTAELRAKEYAQARQEAGGALTNFRGQDITNQGQGFQNITSTQDRAAQQAIALRSADLQAAGMSYDNAIKQAQLEQSGAQGVRAGDIQRLAQEYTNTTQQSQLASQHSLAQRAQDLQAAGMSYDNAFKQAQLEAQQNQFQGTMDMQQRGLNLEGEKMGYGMGLDVQQADMASRQHLADLEAQRYAADRNYQFQQQQADNGRFDKYLGAGIGGAATLLSMLSDKRQKTDIEDADPKDLSDFLGKLKESTFRYKDEKHGKGDHVGVMAQDVEKSRVGKTIVIETPSGKALDMKKALGALLAAGAAQEKRLRKLEARR